MGTTVVGVFDELSAADAACRELEAAGIDKQAIRLTTGEQASTIPSASSDEHAGGMRAFFRRLFGLDEDDQTSGHYSEAVRRGAAVVTVSLDDERRVDEISETLEACGAIDIDERVEQWRATGYSGYDASAAPYTGEQMRQERQKLQVLREDLKVGKRSVGRGAVRVHRRVSERPVEERVSLREEHAAIERHPVDRPASHEELEAMGDADLEIRETAEEPVVSKTARVVEEVEVGKVASERKETVRDTVRRADVEVERSGGYLDDGAPVPGRSDSAYADSDMASSGMGRYAGPERRRPQTTGWTGVERRASAW